MSTTLPGEQTLTFRAFVQWIQEHTNCILGAGWGEATLFDHADLHWDLYEEDERRFIVQLVKGKALIGELVIEGREVHDVTIGPDPEALTQGHYLAELFGDPKTGGEVLGHFVLSHGVEETAARGHQQFRH